MVSGLLADRVALADRADLGVWRHQVDLADPADLAVWGAQVGRAARGHRAPVVRALAEDLLVGRVGLVARC